jgi:HTH-type transcriptional regulator/antitoxin HigA
METVTKSRGSGDSKGLPTEWLKLLVLLYPLQPIHKEADYKKALQAADQLVGRKLTSVQAGYLESLTLLIEDYENDHWAIDEEWTPLEALGYLLKENGMNASDLGRLLGNRSLGSRILRGERALSKNHIKVLSERFSVNPSVFL